MWCSSCCLDGPHIRRALDDFCSSVSPPSEPVPDTGSEGASAGHWLGGGQSNKILFQLLCPSSSAENWAKYCVSKHGITPQCSEPPQSSSPDTERDADDDERNVFVFCGQGRCLGEERMFVKGRTFYKIGYLDHTPLINKSLKQIRYDRQILP